MANNVEILFSHVYQHNKENLTNAIREIKKLLLILNTPRTYLINFLGHTVLDIIDQLVGIFLSKFCRFITLLLSFI